MRPGTGGRGCGDAEGNRPPVSGRDAPLRRAPGGRRGRARRRRLEATDVRAEHHPDERDGIFVNALWKLASAGTTPLECEKAMTADAFRVRRQLAFWVESGALTGLTLPCPRSLFLFLSAAALPLGPAELVRVVFELTGSGLAWCLPRRAGGAAHGRARGRGGAGEEGAAARPMSFSEGHSTGISRPISFWIASREKT